MEDPLDNPELVQQLEAYIASEVSEAAQPPDRCRGTAHLQRAGGFVQPGGLALYVEEQFGVRIDDTELTADTFDTLEQLAQLIRSRRPQ